MSKIQIPHNGFVFVGDGRKALFLRNHGDEKFPQFKVERVLEHEERPTREQGADHPGRGFASGGGPVHAATGVGGRRSAMQQTDWHELAERQFAREVAAALETAVRSQRIAALVVVAPPRTLAELRTAFHHDVKKKIIAEIHKDLTKHPVGEIERHLTAL